MKNKRLDAMLAKAIIGMPPPGKYLLDCYMGRCIRENISHTITARTATDSNTWVLIVSEENENGRDNMP